MKKTYLLAYSPEVGYDQAKYWLNVSDKVITWRTDLPYTFYFISESSADELTEELRYVIDDTGRFLITEIGPNRNGWLPADSWYMFRHKELKSKTQQKPTSALAKKMYDNFWNTRGKQRKPTPEEEWE